MRKIILIFLAGYAIFALTNCKNSGGNSDTGGGGSTLTKILVISDSIGTGFGRATPFPNRIANVVDVTVINDSLNGRQTNGGVAVVGGQLKLHQPSHLLVLLGTNDAAKGIVGGAISNLQAMVNAANAAGVIAIVGTLPPYTSSAQNNNFTAQISNGIRGLRGAAIAEIRNAMGNGSSTIVDGIHPNDKGQQIIADEFLKKL